MQFSIIIREYRDKERVARQIERQLRYVLKKKARQAEKAKKNEK